MCMLVLSQISLCHRQHCRVKRSQTGLNGVEKRRIGGCADVILPGRGPVTIECLVGQQNTLQRHDGGGIGGQYMQQEQDFLNQEIWIVGVVEGGRESYLIQLCATDPISTETGRDKIFFSTQGIGTDPQLVVVGGLIVG